MMSRVQHDPIPVASAVLKDRYLLEQLIGSGGMGAVYRARDLDASELMGSDVYVAVKIIRPEYASDARYRERFIAEIVEAQRVKDAHIVRIIDWGTAADLFMVMDLVDGRDLEQIVQDEGPLAPQEGVELIAQAATAVTAVHRAGVVHRDVKPSNLLVEDHDGGRHVYLSDFGLAKPIQGGKRLTSADQAPGTLPYMAPERLSGATVTQRADIFSLARTLEFALTGKHADKPWDSPSRLLPRRLRRVIAAGIDSDAQNRHASPAEFAQAAIAATRRTLRAPRSSGSHALSARLGALAAGVAASAVAVVLLTGGLQSRSPDARVDSGVARQLVQRHINFVRREDLDGVMATLTDDARLFDSAQSSSVGTLNTTSEGQEEIRAAYRRAFLIDDASNRREELANVRTSDGVTTVNSTWTDTVSDALLGGAPASGRTSYEVVKSGGRPLIRKIRTTARVGPPAIAPASNLLP